MVLCRLQHQIRLQYRIIIFTDHVVRPYSHSFLFSSCLEVSVRPVRFRHSLPLAGPYYRPIFTPFFALHLLLHFPPFAAFLVKYTSMQLEP